MEATLNTVEQVMLDPSCVVVLRNVVVEDLGLETDSGGVLVEVLVVESTLMLEEEVMHLPEPALVGCGLGRFRRMLRVGVDLTQGKVPVDEAQLITQLAPHFPDDMVGRAAVQAFVIGVLDQRHRGRVRTLNGEWNYTISPNPGLDLGDGP